MALRRQTLESVGGLHALVHHLADDAVLGRLVTARGERVALASHHAGGRRCRSCAYPTCFAHEFALGPHHPFAGAGWFRSLLVAIPVVSGPGSRSPCPGLSRGTLALFAIAWLVRSAAMLAVDASLGLPMAVLGVAAAVAGCVVRGGDPGQLWRETKLPGADTFSISRPRGWLRAKG